MMTLIAVPALAGIRTQAQVATQLPANIPHPAANTTTAHLPVETYQNDNHIVITVTKNPEVPPGPIIVIPPPEGTNGNGTIITPGENVSAGNPGNITIITPGGNVTEVPSANDTVTRVDNETVVITPPDRNITETPANVTVIDPPPHPAQLPVIEQPAAAPCKCNQTSIPPVTITPAPGQNVTTLPHPAEGNITSQPLPPATNQTTTTNETTTSSNQTTTTTPGPSNQTGFPAQLPAGNQTGNTTGGNQTQTNTNSTTSSQPPHAQQLPAVATIFPGFHVTKTNYIGPNTQWLNR